jgi:hypothetical protein
MAELCAPVILSDHARRRLRQRFPDLDGVGLLQEFEAARHRRPTPQQLRAIQARCRPATESRGVYCVSPGGIVFVVGSDDVVVTLFPVPDVRGKPHDSLVKRSHRRIVRGAPRRTKEKHRFLRDDP